MSRHLDTLEGKTIGEVYNNHFKGEQMFRGYRRLLKERYPGVKIIPYDKFPTIYVGGDPVSQHNAAKGGGSSGQGMGSRRDHHRQRWVRDLHSGLGEAGGRSRKSGHPQRGGDHHRVYRDRQGGGQSAGRDGAAGCGVTRAQWVCMPRSWPI